MNLKYKLIHFRICFKILLRATLSEVKRPRSPEPSSAVDFGHIVHRTKKMVFICRAHVRDEPAWPDPARSTRS